MLVIKYCGLCVACHASLFDMHACMTKLSRLCITHHESVIDVHKCVGRQSDSVEGQEQWLTVAGTE